MKRDPYSVLGLTAKASDDEIKKAYRSLAKKLHPDLNPGNKSAEAKFKEINSAYELIGMPEDRAKFDRGEIEQAEAAAAQRDRGPYYHQTQQGGGRYSQQFEGMDEDIFSSLFGKMGGQGSAGFRGSPDRPGQDVIYQMEIPFRDAVLGTEQEVTLAGGKRLSVKIPAGVSTGAKLRFGGYGLPGTGKGPAGDAFVEISVKASDTFKRIGNDLEMALPISFSEAILGGEVKTPTLDGSVLLKIPSGVSTGARLRIKGKGVPMPGGARGDQFVLLKIMVPKGVDSDFTRSVEEWSKRETFDPREGWAGFSEVKR